MRGCLKKSYEGRFIDDAKEGKGILTFTNGDSYEGNWSKDKKNGKGVLKRVGHFLYDGEWKNDKREGYGYLKNLSESGKAGKIVYKGSFRDNNMHGKGQYYKYNNQNKREWIYKGDFYNGRMEGEGTKVYSTAIWERGPFVNGERHGMFMKTVIEKNFVNK